METAIKMLPESFYNDFESDLESDSNIEKYFLRFCTTSISLENSKRLGDLYSEVTEDDITKELAKGNFIDFEKEYPRKTQEDHTKIIASLVKILQSNGKFQDGLEIWRDKNGMWLYDGCHRMRAYQYLKFPRIPCSLVWDTSLGNRPYLEDWDPQSF